MNDFQKEEEPTKDEVMIRNKSNIEKELFAEFNNNEHKMEEKPNYEEAKIIQKINEEPIKNESVKENDGIAFFDREAIENKEIVTNDNKFPDMSIDEYMRNFDEKKVQNTTDLFADDVFPSIPM